MGLVSEQHRWYELIQNLDNSYECIACDFEKCDTITFTYKNLKEDIINEYNQQKLRELIWSEITNKVNQTHPLTPNFNKQKILSM